MRRMLWLAVLGLLLCLPAELSAQALICQPSVARPLTLLCTRLLPTAPLPGPHSIEVTWIDSKGKPQKVIVDLVTVQSTVTGLTLSVEGIPVGSTDMAATLDGQ